MNSPLSNRPHFSSLAAGLLIACLPLLAWVERHEGFTWSNRLVIPSLVTENNRHTPLIAEGTFLPPTINSTLTLTKQNSPVILPATTTITPTGHLIVKEGVSIVVLEYGQLIVNGTLTIEGQEGAPVTLTTNEIHPANQIWGGITLMPHSRSTITHTIIEYASPAFTCQPAAQARLTHTTIKHSNLGFLNKSLLCSFENNILLNVSEEVRTTN